MNALILAAGLGTRLGGITKNKQKCMLPIKGKPLLLYWIEALNNLGADKIFINTYFCSSEVKNFIKNVNLKNIILLHETSLLGTGGTLIKNLDLFKNDSLFYLHGDNFINFSLLRSFLIAHDNRQKTKNLTMMTHITNEPGSCGTIELINDEVINFFEKNPNSKSNIANSAIYLLSNNFLNQLVKFQSLKFPISFSDDIIPKFLNQINTYHSKDPVIDIGEIHRYSYANKITF